MGGGWGWASRCRERKQGRLGKGDDDGVTYIQAGYLRHDHFLGRLVRLKLPDLVSLGFDEGVELLFGSHGYGGVPSRSRKEEDEEACLAVCGCKGQVREKALARLFG